MENSEVNKTSDEIINELFSSLNVPLSPKLVEVEERIIIKSEQVSVHTGDSDNSEDDESDSKSSESEGDTKVTVGEMQGNRTEKLKSQKKKKDKRKKKKKHRKKEDGGRHKHRKKKKKESFETAEEAKLAGDVLQDVKLKNQAVIQKIMIREEITPGTMDGKENEKRKSRSRSPKLLDTQSEVDGADNKKKLRESQSPHREVSASPWERNSNLTLESCKSRSHDLASMSEEGASKLIIQSCPTHERSPESEFVSGSTQISPTVVSEHKRKQSPHSCSPSPVKKLKSCSSVSPSKSSSPKAVSRPRSPICTERSRSRSAKDTNSDPCRKRSKSQSTRSGSKSRRSRSRSRKRSESKKRSGSRNRSTSKSRKKSESKLKKRSRSRSKKRSRSRSRRRSRSRSRRRSRSRSRRRARSKSKKRSRSRSKRRSRSKSKMRSRSKSSKRSRSKSSKRSGSKSRRKSASKSKRSKSRDRSRSKSKIGSRSRSQSRRRSSSKSGKRSRSRLRRRSRSKSSKRSSSKSRRSRSRRKSGSQSHRRSRSKSSHKSSPAKERFDMFAVMRERASRLAELKNQGIPDGSLGSLLLSAAVSVQSGGCTSVPQSVPTSDPSSIPLPQKCLLVTDSPAKDETLEESNVGVEEDKPVAVTEDSFNSSSQEQDFSKLKEGSKSKQEEGNEKSKIKTIITIKSLKDSVVFQQAQEEAERKAKEKVDLPENSATDIKWQHNQESTKRQQQDEAKHQNISLEGIEKNSDKNDREDCEEEREERKQAEEKQRGESHLEEMHVEIEDEIMKKLIEKEGRETDKDGQTEKIKNINTEETDIETKTTSRKKSLAKTEEREEDKESKYSGKIEKEERKGSKQSSKVKEDEENDGNELFSESENEDKGNKQSTKAEEKEYKKMRSSSKMAKTEDSKGNEQVNKVEEEEEEEDKRNKKSSKAEEEEEEEEDSANHSSSKRTEEERGNKQSSKAEENEEGKSSKPSNKIEEDISKGSKSSSKAEEKEEEKKSKHSSKTEDKEDSKGNEQCSKGISGKNGHPQPEEDLSDKIEEGEITSDKEEPVTKPSTKTHSKKSKKDKSSTKEKKRSHKDKSKNKEEKKKAHDKKKEDKTRSKDIHKSRQHSNSGSKDHSHSRRHRKHSRSRSHSRDHSTRQHRRSHSRSRSKSRSKRRRESTSDLRDKVTRKRLLEIARRNAVYLMQNGCLPPSVEKEQLVKIKAGGKSVDELTDFCKQLVASGNYSDVDVSDPSMSSEEDNNAEKPFSSTRHPFSVRDSKPILMNIRNAPMLPTKTNAERLAGQAKLREQFPVSSGSQHRTKESEWVPVAPKEKKEEDAVFTKPEPPSVDISQIVSTRLSAMRKLQDNPNDSEAIKTLNNVQKEMQNWALSKQEPGQFTGTTGVKVLSQEELSSGHQAWARKEQFKEAAPVRPHFGLKMLQKMGWSPGEGLGKNKEGTTEPLLLDVKMDKKGFHAQEEVTPKKQPIPLVKDLSGKHPVSALVELCSKRKWSPPDFEMVFDCGPDHKKNFLMKVMVNGQEFKPSVAASTKKMAKANAAAAYLQSLGLYPKDPRYPL